MYDNELNILADSALDKYTRAKNEPAKYLLSSILAGFYIVVATMLSNITASVFYPTSPEIAKFFCAFLFSVAIALIVFVGGDLFTGNNMTMAFGAFQKKTTWGNACRVWLFSYIGNFIGAFFLSGLLILSSAARDGLWEYYSAVVPAKLELSVVQLIVRGVLCNYLVCLAVFIGTKVKSAPVKLALIFCIIPTFVMAGFEHSIANMSTFTIGWFLLGDLSIAALARSFACVTLGNMIGGIVLFALPIKLLSSKTLAPEKVEAAKAEPGEAKSEAAKTEPGEAGPETAKAEPGEANSEAAKAEPGEAEQIAAKVEISNN